MDNSTNPFLAELLARPDGRGSDICLCDLFKDMDNNDATKRMCEIAEEWTRQTGKTIRFFNIYHETNNPHMNIGHFVMAQ